MVLAWNVYLEPWFMWSSVSVSSSFSYNGVGELRINYPPVRVWRIQCTWSRLDLSQPRTTSLVRAKLWNARDGIRQFVWSGWVWNVSHSISCKPYWLMVWQMTSIVHWLGIKCIPISINHFALPNSVFYRNIRFHRRQIIDWEESSLQLVLTSDGDSWIVERFLYFW